MTSDDKNKVGHDLPVLSRVIIDARPTLSQFQSFKIRRTVFLNYAKFVDRRITSIIIEKMVGRELSHTMRKRAEMEYCPRNPTAGSIARYCSTLPDGPF